MYKLCVNCNTEKSLNDFHYKNSKGTYNSWCKDCVYNKQKKRWKDRKRKAVEMLGNQCSWCGYNRNLAAFHFHHLDPTKKNFSWSKLRLCSWETVIEELKNCILLCANCHAELHNPNCDYFIDDQDESNNRLNAQEVYLEPTGFCPVCNKDTYGTKYCSQSCAKISKRKVQRPDKDTLEKEISESSWREIGKKYGVSDSAVRKWAKQYELIN